MKYLLSLLAACAISIFAYLILFGFVVSRPMVVDQISDFMAKKQAYANATMHPKLFIVAGSNARFSHSCAIFEEVLRRPCVNMGISGDIGIDWTLDVTRKNLQRGDLVYMPLEFDFYSRSRSQMITGMDAAYRFRHDKSSLIRQGADRLTHAAFMFSLPILVQSLGEMALSAANIHRRFGLDTMNVQGDEIGHDGEQALSFVGALKHAPQISADPSTLFGDSDGAQATIAQFLDWCHSHGVVAVGGLPTIFSDQPISDAVIKELQRFYTLHGAQFIVAPGKSQYPRSDFYDAGYHLRQSAQLRHSIIIAELLKPLLPTIQALENDPN
jgi:hypothetical protein